MNGRFLYEVEHPLREALKVLMGGKEPPKYVQGYDYSNLTDDQHTHLQDWVNMNLPGTIAWSTGIGVIDAAEHIVEEAVGNANIPPKEERPTSTEKRQTGRKKRRR